MISVFDTQDVEFAYKEIDIGYQMSKIVAVTVKPFSSDWNPVYECM